MFYFFPNSVFAVLIFGNSFFSILIFGNPNLVLLYYQKQCVFNVNDLNVHKLNRNYLKLIEVTNIFPQYCTVK